MLFWPFSSLLLTGGYCQSVPPNHSYKNIFVLKASKNWVWVIEKEMKRILMGFPVPKIAKFAQTAKQLGVVIKCGTFLAKESWPVPFQFGPLDITKSKYLEHTAVIPCRPKTNKKVAKWYKTDDNGLLDDIFSIFGEIDTTLSHWQYHFSAVFYHFCIICTYCVTLILIQVQFDNNSRFDFLGWRGSWWGGPWSETSWHKKVAKNNMEPRSFLVQCKREEAKLLYLFLPSNSVLACHVLS